MLLEDGTPELISVDQAPDPSVPPTYRDCDADPTGSLPQSFSHMWAAMQRLKPTRGKRRLELQVDGHESVSE